MQAERDAILEKIHDAKRRVPLAQNRHVELQRQLVVLSTRNADAASALAALRSLQPPTPATTAAAATTRITQGPSGQSSGLGTSATVVCGGHDDDTCMLQPSSIRGGPRVSSAAGPQAPRQACTALARAPKPRGTPTLQQPWAPSPRPIAEFLSAATISYGDLRAAADPAARLVNFSQHAMSTLLPQAMASKAARLRPAQACTDVCWFVQTPYEVATGTPLSVSASLSSPECTASFALHFLMSKLELTFITAASECSGSGAGVAPDTAGAVYVDSHATGQPSLHDCIHESALDVGAVRSCGMCRESRARDACFCIG